MKIRKHYLTLRRSFPEVHEEQPLETTLEELAAHLDCTHRNMVLLLKRMQQEHWLTWLPKKGRSNRSTLIFTARKEDILLEEAKELVAKQDLRSALELLHASEHAASLREQFQDWLSGQFGFRSEVQGQRRTDILRFPLMQTIHALDPVAIHYAGESHLVNQLFDGLVRMDAKGEQILPHLAHAWDVDASRTIWTFYLRKGVQFHHGREMLASDVKYSLERLQSLAPRGLYSWAYAGIISITIPDETTICLQLAEHNELFLGFLTTNRASIVPADVCEASGGMLSKSPIGTGPFRLTGHDQGIWILEAFPAYFQGRGFLDRVEVWTLPENEQTDLSDKRQPFQVMHNVRISDMDAQRWQQVRQSGMTTKFMTVNELKDGPLRNPLLRKALNLALDRAYLLEQLSGDVIEAASSFFPQTQPDTGSLHQSKATGPKELMQLIDASGYLGDILKLATIPQYEQDALLLQKVYAKSGITIEIMLIPAEEFKGELRMTADLLLFAVMLDEHRELRLYDMYKSIQQHAAPEVQTLLNDSLRHLRSESDLKRRMALLEQLESQLKQRHSLLFLYRKHLKTAYHPSIRGISLDSLGWVRFRDIWFT
ncbi:DNA-binding transcriptional regulator SgrR of sgrS sRNA, contains a MarR-type HTH domain and a solute-binding domain [Paenibacillus sp. yr247]|uniref:ABC transporter substrate-binding protein n=1 Tax=Paenibacillus sp. yr247 TaxID=1761880 RepID=UPI00088450F1|nr:ABC transporter substrate-binding protein [Paenibacillus sp. yr247]SDN02211.1 DNA-binding transcriptional regulator SgrR of sgrS sRNA, contains a MarR-type HTH domain and a solute-binding domain [Paenibacillus sp. yr247]